MKKSLALLAVFFFAWAQFAFAQAPCEGNFDCDQDVDGTDAAVFKEDFGRNPFQDPCPNCPPPAGVPITGQTTSFAAGDDGNLEAGVTWPNPRFKDNGDGTVDDNLTGLVWLKNASCNYETYTQPMTWNDALLFCNGLAIGYCGLTDDSSSGDWRLPNRFELASLLNLEYVNLAIPNTTGTGQWSEGDPFNNLQANFYWSGTTRMANTSFAWNVNMYSGDVNHVDKSAVIYVWPVRDNHSGSNTSTTTTTIACIQQGCDCTFSLECCDGCCCNGAGLFVCTTIEQCNFLGGGCN